MRQRIGSVLALLAFFMALEATAQVNVSKGGDDWAARLQQQGWQQTAPGVFQRQSASGQLETLAIGQEGLGRALQELQHRLTTLSETYRTSPSAELEKAIVYLKSQIAELEKTISEQGAGIPSTLPSGCNFSFGCSAYAAPLSSSQGVTASSSSYFYNDCSYQATVYADAYGYTNGGGSGDYQWRSTTGANVSVSAAISVPGGPSCFSDAAPYVNSSSLGLYYSCYQSNSNCPALPLDVSVSGPSNVYVSGYNCTTAYYSASASGGTPPYSYSWSTDYGSGSGSSFSITFCGDNFSYTEYVNVSVTATDSASGSASDSMTTVVHYQDNGCPYLNSQDRPWCPEPY